MTFTLALGALSDNEGFPRPVAGMPIDLSDFFLLRQLFRGFITRVEPRKEVGVGELILLDIECTDLTYILINHHAQESYTGQTLKYIVEDLVNTYISGYGLGTSEVDIGPTIDTVQFNHINLRQCFQKLSEITGYEWWVDFEYNIHFKPKGYTLHPETFTDTSQNYSHLEVNVDGTQVRNSIVIEGGKELSGAYWEDIWVGDGQARSFVLTYKPKEAVSVELDTGSGYGSPLNFGVDPLNNELDVAPSPYDFLFNYQEKFVRNAIDQSTLAAGHKLRIRYFYEADIVTKIDDEASIAYMQAIEEEGGDGVHDFYVKDESIASLEEAIAYAQQQFEEFGFPTYDIRIETRSGLLSTAGTYFTPGQVLAVQFPSWSLPDVTQFLIQEVVTTFVDDGTDIEYLYQIRIGGKRITTTSVLEKLLTKKDPVDDTVEQRKVHSVRETAGFTETVSRETDRADTATAGFTESVSSTITTPPYRWGESPASSKPGKWGLAVWAS